MRSRARLPIIEEIIDAPAALAACERLKGYRYSFFLDSAAGHEKLGKFSFLGCEPFLVFKSKGSSVSLEWDDGSVERFDQNPFLALKDIMARYDRAEADKRLPFISGGVGYFAYDLKDFIEDLPNVSKDDLGISDCVVAFYDVVMIYDHEKANAYIASSGLSKEDADGDIERAKERLKKFKEKVLKESGKASTRLMPHNGSTLISDFSKASYVKAVSAAKEYIRKGDIYQVNLSQRFEAQLPCEPFELYSRLRMLSPAPFSAYLDLGDCVIASSSPERFLFKKGSYIETRPIKGTRPRGEDDFTDSMLEAELLRSGKDRAEHVMIVDLERNDLGRICEYGSVRPTEFTILEKYATVFHLVSTVSGLLKRGVDQVDCLLATFPGGSITGAPKIRSMQIIEELEPVKRSVYTGAIGYLSFDGNMDTSIAIRTFVIKDNKVYFQVGGGIVADSDPEKEYDETLDKAKAMMQSLGMVTNKMRYDALCQI